MMILVTGATGNVGSQVVRELLIKNVPVRAFVRDAARATEKLGNGVHLAVGDFSDAASVRRALEGVELVFLTSADGPQKVAHETRVIDEAAASGVRWIVKLSTVRAEAGSPLPPFDWHGRIEQHLQQSGLPVVILQSTFFMSNLLASAEAIKHTGKLFAPANGARIAMIDPQDVAAVAAVVLTTDGHEGERYVLTATEAVTYELIAAELSVVTGRLVEFVNVPDEAARQGFIEAGMPDWLVQHLVALFGIIRQGALEQTTSTVRALTGREPRSFGQFAREHARLFGAQ